MGVGQPIHVIYTIKKYDILFPIRGGNMLMELENKICVLTTASFARLGKPPVLKRGIVSK